MAQGDDVVGPSSCGYACECAKGVAPVSRTLANAARNALSGVGQVNFARALFHYVCYRPWCCSDRVTVDNHSYRAGELVEVTS